ncbi:nitroreductase family protein [Lactobacillus crispatus]|uniref:nitroreductase family protein n=1 Tax=Lactobacillus crispatus TaxID=47770 RepID=UPI001E2E3F4C|nr:nitroreductase family protein [Lactobacillus crispatus]
MVNSIFTNRRAVRNFSKESISDNDLKNLIVAFQTAPCGMHQTDVMNLVVVKDEGLRNKIEEKTDNACYNAPVLFVINTKKDSMFGERDASCAAENIMLAATDLGLGSVYVMGGAVRLDDAGELQKELGIDPAFQTSIIVPVGKIAEKPEETDRSNRYQVTIY